MTKEEIVEAIANNKMLPYINTDFLPGIVDFVLDSYKPSLPSNLDEAAEKYATEDIGYNPDGSEKMQIIQEEADAFKAGAEWMAGQGKTKEAVIGIATEEISINVSQQTLDELDLCSGDKVVVQIRKK